MSCDWPFDESEIAPELWKENSSVDTPDSRRREGESHRTNCTNVEPVDISTDRGASGIPSTPPQNIDKETIEPTVEEYCNQESIYNETFKMEKNDQKSIQKKLFLQQVVYGNQ